MKPLTKKTRKISRKLFSCLFAFSLLMKSRKEKMFIPCFLLDVSTLGQHVLIIKVTNSPWGLDSSRPAMKMQSVSSLFQTMMM